MRERAARPAVMLDVARLAGVSHQTVSRVVNDSPNVRPDTRHRVLTAMAELGYRRNSAARALVTRRSHTLGVVTSDTTLHGPAHIVWAIERAARERGWFVSICTVDDLSADALGVALDRLSSQSVDGALVLAPQREAVQALTDLAPDLPAVTVEGGGAPHTPWVAIDQSGGAELAVRHLLDLGHRRLAHLAGRSGWVEAEARAEGWRSALATAGLPEGPLLHGDWSPRSGYEAGRELLRRQDGTTAVFAANDQMALGLLRALAEAGVRVPEDVSVVGFDDIPEAAFLHPPLTTVRQDFATLGRRSVELLLRRIDPSGWGGDGPDAGPERAGGGGPVGLVPAELVVRRSSGPPR